MQLEDQHHRTKKFQALTRKTLLEKARDPLTFWIVSIVLQGVRDFDKNGTIDFVTQKHDWMRELTQTEFGANKSIRIISSARNSG